MSAVVLELDIWSIIRPLPFKPEQAKGYKSKDFPHPIQPSSCSAESKSGYLG